MSRDSRPEDEWFARHEEELLRQARRERKARDDSGRQASEGASLPRCPRCSHDLREEQIVGVTIDRCTSCEGVFLDRGELEEILLQKAGERRSFFRKLVGLGPD